MSQVFIAGVGMTPTGKFLERSLKDLTREAVETALRDAGLARGDLSAAFFSNATQSPLEGQHMIAGQVALGSIGIERIPVVNVENACASGSTAFHLAYAYIKAGMGDVVLAVGAEKMYGTDREKTFSVFDGAWDVHRASQIVKAMQGIGEGVEIPPSASSPAERSVFMDVYASLAKQHMRLFGTTQRQMAAVSAKNHRHSVHNPLSQYRKDMSIDDVLGARVISWPLTLPMCSPISDGAAAAILVSESRLTRMAKSAATRILASIVATSGSRPADDYANHVCRRAAAMAYEASGVDPRDVSVAEVHDASAFGELLQSELLGFAEPGQGGWLAERGETTIGGRIPINPSGGLESKGHPIGATGLGQIHELVMQLRHAAGPRQVAGARIALAENGGGFQGYEEAVAGITLLAKQ